MHSRISVVVVAVALLAAACGGGGGSDEASNPTTTGPTDGGGPTTSTSTAPPAAELPDPVLEPRVCERDPADGVSSECFWLVVPENRAAFDGDTLRLAVTVLASTNPEPLADPVVYLSGGPGYPGGGPNYWSSVPSDRPLIDDRDVIIYDQRGTGRSEPDLECPEMEAVALTAFGDNRPYEEEVAEMRDAISGCRDRIVGEGTDLTAFSTTESAADLADLRIALGYDEWNLFGISYGTRLALETMRSYPEGIRSVILDSTYPMDEVSVTSTIDGVQRAFDQLADGCAADPACAEANGDLRVALDDLVARFDAEPHVSRIDIGGDVGEIDIVITGADIIAGLFTAMYDSALIPVLPAFASALARGEGAELIDQVAIQGIPRINGVAEGMALSTNCADSSPLAEEAAAADEELVADPGRWSSILTLFSTGFCELWTYAEVDESFVEPVTSDLPTLVLSGSYDPITSTPEAELVANSLGSATFVVFNGLGHGVWDVTPCGTDILLAFLADPTVEPDTTCAAEVGPPAFG